MIIHLLRHAEAEAAGRGGREGSEPRLTTSGRGQAERLATLLGGADIRRFLSSPARRCLETLAPLAEATPGTEIEIEPRLLEGAPLSGLLEVVESLEDEPSLLCSHGDLIPHLLRHFQGEGLSIPEGARCQKASTWMVKRSRRGWSAHYLPPPDPEAIPLPRGATERPL